MIFKQATISTFCAALLAGASMAGALTASAQATGPSSQSGADFGSGSTSKKDAENKPDDAEKSSDSAKETTGDTTASKDETAESTKPEEKPEDKKAENKKPESPQTAKVPGAGTPGGKEDAVKTMTPEPGATATKLTTTEPEAKPANAETDKTTTGATGISLTVASWGGAYSESQDRAYFSPFEAETGIAIKMVTHKGKFDPLTSSGIATDPKWDIVDLDLAALDIACRNGSVEKIEVAALTDGKDGKPAASDFLPGTLHECGIPSVAWSSAIVFDKRAFEKAQPKTAKDLFDTKSFPGKRALPRDPKYVLELALMADGVKPENVYAELSGDEGLKRAFKQLDRIRDDIVWWNKANEPLSLLAKKEAAIALAFNGRIFSAIVAENKPFGIIWDAQVFDLDFWAIPKGSAHKQSSQTFIAFATRPESLARQANWFPYGPVRKSALELVGTHPEINVKMTQYMPTAPDNFKHALRLDPLWWNKNGDAIRTKFMAWSKGPEDSSSFEDEQQ